MSGKVALAMNWRVRCFSEPEAYPSLCEDLLRALLATDDQISASATVAVPAAVSQAVRERAGRLRPDTRAAVDWAAVLATPFTFEQLEAVGGEAAGSAPELLAKDGFLVSDGAGGWSFVHSIVREAVHLAMSERERVRGHAAVVDVLAAGQLERRAPQLAAARRYVDAAAAYLGLAHRALDRVQGEDAVRLFDLSAELAEEAGDVAVSLDAVAGRVLALLRCGAVDEARSEADGLRRELRDIDDVERRLGFLSRYANALSVVIHDVDGAREVLDEAEPLRKVADGSLLAEALAVQTHVRVLAGDSAGAIPDAERAVDLATRSDDVLLLIRALGALGLAIGVSRGSAEGMTILEPGAELARAANAQADEARLRVNQSYLAGSAGDLVTHEEHVRRGLELEAVPASLHAFLHGNLGQTLGSGATSTQPWLTCLPHAHLRSGRR